MLVEGEHVDVPRGNHVGRPLGVADEPHPPEAVPALELVDPLPPGAFAAEDLRLPADDDVHLGADLAAPDDRRAGREMAELAHEHDDAGLRGPEAREEWDRARRVVPELHAEEVPERDA